MRLLPLRILAFVVVDRELIIKVRQILVRIQGHENWGANLGIDFLLSEAHPNVVKQVIIVEISQGLIFVKSPPLPLSR
jgi:hypothetical protein